MILFITGLIIFLATHFFTAFARNAREGLVAATGRGGYMALYSVVSLVGFVLIAKGWPSVSAAPLYTLPAALRPVTYGLVFISFILFAAAYLPVGKIAETTRHPMLAGVKIWAFAHLLSNGEIRSVILFGTFLAFAVIDRIAVKRRGAPTRTGGRLANDILALCVGAALYVAVFAYLHPLIAGVALVP
ncbi:MAG: NnrU family protein [Pseudomonadota bacterium]